MPDAVDRAIRARSMWSGTISFGLVSIPVNLYPASRPGGVSLRMLDDDGTPLARRYYDPETEKEIPRERIVRGFEIDKDEYVVVTDEELDALEPEKTRDIDLRRFVDADALDPVFFERAYFLAPGGQSTKAYRLLAAVMERTNRAGIATFVMRTKEYLIAILSENGILRAETLRFHDEIRGAEEIDLPDHPKLTRKKVDAVRKEIDKLSRKSLEESELEDDYSQRLLKLVERKRKKGTDVVTAPASAIEDEDGGAEVIDLMEVLKRSLRGAGHADGGADQEDLAARSKAELYEQAQQLDIPGRSSMNKTQLIRAIRKSA